MKKINEVIAYVETHINEEINYDSLSNIVGYSTFYFHRIFTMLFGITIGEYIRYRRLTLAATEVRETNKSILNIAYEFQYQTPEGFTKAFKQFHGCSPTQMRKTNSVGKKYNILCFENIVVDKNLYYSVKEISEFSLKLMKRSFLDNNPKFNIEIQKYWKELQNNHEYIDLITQNNPIVFEKSIYIAVDMKKDNESKYFEYGVGIETSDKKKATIVIPKTKWLVFPCIGPVNTSLMKTWRQVYYYFIKESEWQLSFDFNLEVYYSGDKNRSDYKCEVWFPVRRKRNV